MATIEQVATLAGVSPATVSRVFNGQLVSEEKAARVRAAAERLRYVPNRVAQNLRRGRSDLIALIVPDVGNPYFTELARGVEDVAREAGFSVVLGNSDDDPQREADYLRTALAGDMAGVLLAPATQRPALEELLTRNRPVVLLDRGSGYELDEVVMSNYAAGHDAVDLLVADGYRRIACITGPRAIETARDRAEGWFQTVAARGMTDADDYLRYTSFQAADGRAAAHELLDLAEPPDAVVATNPPLAIGVLQALADRGIRPPAVGLCVIGSWPFRAVLPELASAIQLPSRLLGETAARVLLERIAGDTQPPRRIRIPHDPPPDALA